jgi:hypothetical protein
MLFSNLLGALALSASVVQATTPHKAKETKNGAVASEDSRCTKIGIDILKQNGTAADAVSISRLHRRSPNSGTNLNSDNRNTILCWRNRHVS